MLKQGSKKADEAAAGVEGTLPKPAEFNGIMTEQALLQRIFGQNVTAVATDRFINKSRDAYNLPFLAREVTQNWVDHNPRRGTLDGVEVKVEENAGAGMHRVTITGGWDITDVTGLTHLHSDKPGEGESAGGNGIGLKQVAIRYLRDFAVTRFDVDGNSDGRGFRVSYRLVKASEANLELGSRGVPQRLRHDWLVAQLADAPENAGGKCSYTIETGNEDIVRSLRQVERIGVSARNPLLANPDFDNGKGSLRWQTTAELEAGEPTGLFINGQAWSFMQDGPTIEGHFRGPEGVTVRLNDLKHDMSIDRPPIDRYRLERYVDGLVSSMGRDELVGQLKKSEHIWGALDDRRYGSDRLGSFVVIEKMVEKLVWRHSFKADDFNREFQGRTYVCRNEGVSDEQVASLRADGCVVCPPYFERLGVPRASGRFSSFDEAAMKKPELTGYKQKELAREFGFVVAAEGLGDATGKALLERMMEGLADAKPSVEETGANRFRVRLKGRIPEDALFHPLHSPKTGEQKRLHFIRGVVKAGLESGAMKSVFTSTGEYVTTYATQYDSVAGEHLLVARNVRNEDAGGAFIEFELKPELSEKFRVIAGGAKKPAEAERQSGGEHQGRSRRLRRMMAAAAGVALTAAVGALVFVKPGGQGNGLADKPRVEAQAGAPSAQAKMVVASSAQELEAAVRILENIIPARAADDKGPAEQYGAWKTGGDFYGQAAGGAEYLKGGTLRELIMQHNSARVEPAGEGEDGLNATLQALANRLAPPEDRVEGFEIVLKPAERQLAQLGLMRKYLHIATGAAVPHDFFIFRGRGAKGVNIGGDKAIGFHEGMLDTLFESAVGTGAHELAHTHSMGHGREFIAALQSTMGEIARRLGDINERLDSGSGLTGDDRALLDIREGWDSLRAK